MKKYYLKILFLIVLFTFPLKVKADCSNIEKVRLQKLAGNVNFSYRYKESSYGTIVFGITVSNLTSELYMIDHSSGKRYYSDNQDFTISDYKPGKTIQFDFYEKSGSCIQDVVFTNYVTLPYYNTYYNSRICQDVQEFKLCQKWLKTRISYKKLYEEITKYKTKKLIEQEEKNVEEVKKTNYEKIVEFWAKYYIYILLTIIIICSGLRYYLDKKTDL